MASPDAASDTAVITPPAATVAAASAELDGEICTVSGTLDFDTAPGCLATVSDYIAEQRSLTIDLAGVERSNSAGLALIIEWLAQARHRGTR